MQRKPRHIGKAQRPWAPAMSMRIISSNSQAAPLPRLQRQGYRRSIRKEGDRIPPLQSQTNPHLHRRAPSLNSPKKPGWAAIAAATWVNRGIALPKLSQALRAKKRVSPQRPQRLLRSAVRMAVETTAKSLSRGTKGAVTLQSGLQRTASTGAYEKVRMKHARHAQPAVTIAINQILRSVVASMRFQPRPRTLRRAMGRLPIIIIGARSRAVFGAMDPVVPTWRSVPAFEEVEQWRGG